jgi:hypothetical protein
MGCERKGGAGAAHSIIGLGDDAFADGVEDEFGDAF